MINNELHKQTQYRIPQLRQEIRTTKERIGSFVIDCNERNWDSYNGKLITVKTLKFAVQVLHEIGVWFEENIGFLNNRSFEIDATPSCNGTIRIKITYDGEFVLHFETKYNELIECSMCPVYILRLDGTKTISDRNFKLMFSKDILVNRCDIEGIKAFLNEGFYKHKWCN